MGDASGVGALGEVGGRSFGEYGNCMKMSTDKMIAIGFGLAVLILVAVGLLQYRTTQHLVEAAQLVFHADEDLAQIQSLLSGVKDAESGVRGYVATGDERFLAPYQGAAAESAKRLKGLRQLTSGNAAQQKRLDALEPLVSRRFDHLGKELQSLEEGGLPAAREFMKKGEGLRLTNSIIQVAAEMENEERRLLVQRNAAAEASTRRINAIILAGSLVAIGLLFGAAVIIGRDAAERKRAEMAQQQSEEQYRLLVETVQEYAIILLDPNGRVTTWNEGAERIKGYRAEEILGQHFSCFYTPEDKERGKPEEELKTAVVQGKFEDEGWRVRKNGARFWATVVITALLDKERRIKGFSKVTRDITERKQAEENLRRSEEQFRLLLNSTAEAIYGVDVSGNCTFCNRAFLHFLGYSDPHRLLGQNIHTLIHHTRPDGTPYREEDCRIFQTLREGRISHADDEVLWRADGTSFPVESWSTPILRDNQIIGCVVAFVDITERKQAELALERANRALRTLSACNEALVHAANESELLDSVCRLIVETGGYRMARVGVPERDPAKTVRMVAHYGYEDEYLSTAQISWADTALGRGPTGTAIRTGTVQINRNFLTDPALAPWREAALKRGYRSSIALPLQSSAGILGALTIYAPEPSAFDDAAVKLLQELAADIAFGIETLRTRAERDRNAYEHIHHVEMMRQGLEDSIKAIANTVEMRDPYTAGHQRRVGELAAAIARELGLPEETIHGIELAASIHDLGKIRVPAEILAKPAKLTDIEIMYIRTHVQAGYDILKNIKFPWPIATMVLQHHERLDGSGYPQGLKGEQIILEARILAVADMVEATSSHRPYRPARGIDTALEELFADRETRYDPAVVDACLKLFREKGFKLGV